MVKNVAAKLLPRIEITISYDEADSKEPKVVILELGKVYTFNTANNGTFVGIIDAISQLINSKDVFKLSIDCSSEYTSKINYIETTEIRDVELSVPQTFDLG